jgi:alpha-1,6-mannosyltransferase
MVAASLAVAVLASRPDSPFTPFLYPGYRAPGVLRWVAELFQLDRLQRDAAALLGAVLLCAAAAAFVWALREAWRGRITVRTVIAVAIGLHVVALVIPLFVSRDVYSYAYYGRMISEYGVNPYIHTPGEFLRDPFYLVVSNFWIDSPSVYGPAFTALSAGITSMFDEPVRVILAFKLVSAAASVATMLVVVAAARRVRPERAAFAAMLVGWNPVIVFHNVAGGHNDALVGLAVAAGALLVLRGRDLWATAALALGALVKASTLLPLIVLIAAVAAKRPPGKRLRAAGAHVGVAALVALPFMAPFFTTEDPTFGQLELASRQGWLAPSRFLVVTLRGLARTIGGDVAGDITSAIVRIVFPVLLVTVVVWLTRHAARRRSGEPEVAVAAMGWATLFGLMLAPLLLPWYAAWVVPLAWLLPRPARTGAVFISVALVITELMSEPTRSPRVWEVMVIWLHWVATPIVLLVLIRLLLELRRRVRLGPGSPDPLLIEEPLVPSRILGLLDRALSGPEGGEVAGQPQNPRRRGPPGAERKPQPVGGAGAEDEDPEPG